MRSGPDTCRSCGTPIEWATWPTSGKAMPVDLAPDPNGKLVVIAGKLKFYTDDDAKLHRDRRTSHFATCPSAKEHRKK